MYTWPLACNMADDYDADGYNWDNQHIEYMRGFVNAAGNYVWASKNWNYWNFDYVDNVCIYYQLCQEEE